MLPPTLLPVDMRFPIPPGTSRIKLLCPGILTAWGKEQQVLQGTNAGSSGTQEVRGFPRTRHRAVGTMAVSRASHTHTAHGRPSLSIHKAKGTEWGTREESSLAGDQGDEELRGLAVDGHGLGMLGCPEWLSTEALEEQGQRLWEDLPDRTVPCRLQARLWFLPCHALSRAEMGSRFRV